MPLILMCGFPCSGKSTKAQELKKFFEETCNVEIIADEKFKFPFDKNAFYSDSAREKEIRSFLRSEVQRHLSKRSIVILDSLNYIKGYRYEMYCLSKSSKTTSCVIHFDLLPEDCLSFDRSRPKNFQYDSEVFEALVQRFEAPDSKNRWDSPLFTIHKDESLPYQEIYDALILRQPPPPNLSTQVQPIAPTNYLQDLDKATQDVVKAIVESQRTRGVGELVHIPSSKETLFLPRSLGMAELTRLRRQFISYVKGHTIDVDHIPDTFVQYINSSI